MANYYIDYENVHNEGLKGVHKLEAGDKICLFYSNRADTLKIDVVKHFMECEAEISFVKIVNGVENALDFQLITALMCNYRQEENYYIISRDRGYDAAIEMATAQNRNNIYRCRDIDGAIKHQVGLGIDESDQDVIAVLDAAPWEEEEDQSQQERAEEANDGAFWEAEESSPYAEDDMTDAAEDAAEDVSVSDEFSETGEETAEAEAEDENEPESYEENHAESAEQLDLDEIFSGPTDMDPKEAAEEEVAETEEIFTEEQDDAHDGSDGKSVAEEELQRRAYQSICTKLMNHIKLTQKIPFTYKDAGIVYEALATSDGKMKFYHRLTQLLGRKRGGGMYQKIKGSYKSIYGIYQHFITSENALTDMGKDSLAEKNEPETAENE